MRRRHHVALRPHARVERRARFLALGALAGLSALSFVVVRSFPRERLSAPDLAGMIPLPSAARIEHVDLEGAPPVLEPLLREALGEATGRAWGLKEPYLKAAQLEKDFACLKHVGVSRDWLGRALRFSVTLRVPAARALRSGVPAGWLSDEGVLFDAPEGSFPDAARPTVELGSGALKDLRALAQFVEAAALMPSRPSRVAYQSPEDGWEIQTEDGTRLLWGGLDWTEQKLNRLREVLADAGKRFGPGLVLDLRYFEDGRILVRPTASGVKRG